MAILFFLNHKGETTLGNGVRFSTCENVVFIKPMERGYFMMLMLLQTVSVLRKKTCLATY